MKLSNYKVPFAQIRVSKVYRNELKIIAVKLNKTLQQVADEVLAKGLKK